MKLRLYHDTRKKFRFCVDAWTIYVPYPKWLRKERYDAKGIYLGCSPTEAWSHSSQKSVTDSVTDSMFNQ